MHEDIKKENGKMENVALTLERTAKVATKWWVTKLIEQGPTTSHHRICQLVRFQDSVYKYLREALEEGSVELLVEDHKPVGLFYEAVLNADIQPETLPFPENVKMLISPGKIEILT